MEKKKLTPITCDNCGKRIVKGRTIYSEEGSYFKCCSAECLLYMITCYETSTSTGYVEKD